MAGYEMNKTGKLASDPTTMDITELTALADKIFEAQNSKPSLKSKLCSRKFWVTAAGCITGICGMISCNESPTAIIAFAIVEVVSIIVYCVSEGTMDALHKKQLMVTITSMITTITDAVNKMTVTNVSNTETPSTDGEASDGSFKV